jgi:hypothetical protein
MTLPNKRRRMGPAIQQGRSASSRGRRVVVRDQTARLRELSTAIARTVADVEAGQVSRPSAVATIKAHEAALNSSELDARGRLVLRLSRLLRHSLMLEHRGGWRSVVPVTMK